MIRDFKKFIIIIINTYQQSGKRIEEKDLFLLEVLKCF